MFHRLLFLSLVVALTPLAIFAEDWPDWLGEKRDGVVRSGGLLEKFPEAGPKELWRVPVGMGYSGPAVAQGKVYLTDRELAKDAKNPGNPFARGKIQGNERILCLEEASGKILWKHEYDCPYDISYAYGPRCTPVIHGDKVYCLGSMGNLLCLNKDDGKVVWQVDFQKQYEQKPPVWGWSSAPLIDGDHIICLVGGKGSVAVAFDKNTGKEVWRALDGGEPGYAPPMIYELGGTRQLIVWHPQGISSLNPVDGKHYWTETFKLQANLSIPTPRKYQDDKLFVTSFYNGPKLLQVTGSPPMHKVLWQGNSNSESRTDKLHSIMVTPFFVGDYIYGICSYGQLRCLKAETGERVWETKAAVTAKGKQPPRDLRWGNAFLIQNGEKSEHFFLFNELGELISAKLTPKGYEELSRAKLVEPTQVAQGRDIVWTHPAIANRKVFARNDKELACFDLSKKSE